MVYLKKTTSISLPFLHSFSLDNHLSVKFSINQSNQSVNETCVKFNEMDSPLRGPFQRKNIYQNRFRNVEVIT